MIALLFVFALVVDLEVSRLGVVVSPGCEVVIPLRRTTVRLDLDSADRCSAICRVSGGLLVGSKVTLSDWSQGALGQLARHTDQDLVSRDVLSGVVHHWHSRGSADKGGDGKKQVHVEGLLLKKSPCTLR